MKRRHVLLILILLIGGWLLIWPLSPKHAIKMLVVDKTVPEPDFREHRAIFWIAEHRRFARPDGTFYRTDQDYLGFHPLENRKEELSMADLNDVTLLYLADSYGIYDYEEGLALYEELLPHLHQDIELLYGGFSPAEVGAVEAFALKEGASLVGEHNIFGYPTYLNPDASERLQALFALNYTGWLARYYSDLDEAAFWLKELYSQIYGLQWDLSGPGLVFVREEVPAFEWRTDLVVITGDNFNGPWPVLRNFDHSLTAGALNNVPYLYWVEVLEVLPEAEILAYYELPLGEEARQTLRARGLPDQLPALVYHSPPGEALRIYFAGDFADQLPALLPPSLTGSAAKQRFFSYLPGLPVEYRFYFKWYEPVLANILRESVKE
jgi:hypothetical protein